MADTMQHVLFGKTPAQQGELAYDLADAAFSPNRLHDKSVAFRQIAIDDILRVLEHTGALFIDPCKTYMEQCLDTLPAALGYAPEMVKKGLDLFAQLLSRRSLQARLACLGNRHCLDYFYPQKGSAALRAMPLGAVAHIAAGNVFIGSVDSLIYGIITKNVNVLKASSQDFLFPSLFFRALEEADASGQVYPFTALTYWSRANKEVTRLVKERFDAILLFGGENAVLEYKNGLSAACEMVAFGPKLSFALVTAENNDAQLREAARGLALDIVLWEQRACTSCQNIFIEDRGQVDDFAHMLHQALEELANTYPQANLDVDSRVEMRRQREEAHWQAFNGKAKVWQGERAGHTVIVARSNLLVDSALNRTVYINAVDSYEDVLSGNLPVMKYYMSTLAIAGQSNLQQIIEDFMEMGVMRFCRPGAMGLGVNESAAHDGRHIPELLVRYINTEDIPQDSLGLAFTRPETRAGLLLARLNDQLLEAQKSPFYREFHGACSLPLPSLEAFSGLPILEKHHLAENGPPISLSMLTRNPERAYIFSAGGTTGSAKYVYYSAAEFARSAKLFGDGFRNAGIGPGDIAGNFMRAGSLWTAFPATNLGLEETGCTILSLTANQSYSDTLDYIETFHINCLLSISGNLVLLAEQAQKEKRALKIEKIYYSGEHLAPAARRYLRQVFSPRVIASLGYAAVEIGPIGYQCSYCRGTEHHVFDDYVYVEIDEQGDVLVTTLARTLHPLFRYRIGDRAEWAAEPCPCGRQAPRLRLLARSGDMVRLNTVNVYLRDVARSLAAFPELSPFFQMEVSSSEHALHLRITIETNSDLVPLDDDALLGRIRRRIIDESAELKDCWDISMLQELQVVLVKPNTIKRIGRTGKIRQIIDRRV